MYNLKELKNDVTVWLEANYNNVSGDSSMTPYEMWASNKSAYLFDVLQGKLVQSKEIEIEKHLDETLKEIRDGEFIDKLTKAINKQYMDNNGRNLIPFEETEKRTLLNVITNYTKLAEQTLYRDFLIESPYEGSRITKFLKGTRLTRVMRALIPDDKDYQEIATEYSRFFNQKKIKGNLCLSVHPLDCFSVSNNNCGWRSCFNVEDGEYKISTTGLLTAKDTMIAYLKSEGDIEVNNGDVRLSNKRWRAYVTFAEDQKYIHVGRQYPYTNPKLADEIVKFVSELTNKTYRLANDEEKKKFKTDVSSQFYDDGIHTVYIQDDMECPEETVYFKTSGDLVCMECGAINNDGYAKSLLCDCCEDHKWGYCDCCGRDITHDDHENGDYYYVASTDEYYCYDCGEDLYYCDDCGEYYFGDDMVCIQIRIHSGWYDIHICEHCLSRSIRRGNLEFNEELDMYVTSKQRQIELYGNVKEI